MSNGAAGENVVARLQARLRPERGAAAVEFALILPILVLLLFGIIAFGHAFNLQQDLSASVREGARAASLGAGSGVISTALTNAISPDFNNGGDITVVITAKDPSNNPVAIGALTPCAAAGVGGTVTITGTVPKTASGATNYAISIPFFGNFKEQYQAAATFRCESTGA